MHRTHRHLPVRLRAAAIAPVMALEAALQPLRPRVRGFRGWVAETAIRLSSLTGWEDVEVLSALDPLLEGKRFAFIGENDHWVHEKYPYRLLLIRYLHSRGWRAVGEELSFSDGVRVDRYLVGGDPSELDRVVTYGYRGCARGDRDDSPRGALRGMRERHPAAMGTEQKEFARALRSLARVDDEAAEGPLRFFGFDVDYEPGAAYELLEQVLATAASDGAVVRLRGALDRVLGETLAEEVERLDRACVLLEERRDALEQVLGPTGFATLRRLVRTAAISHRYVQMIQAAVTFEDLRPAMALRERLMLEHVEYAVSLGRPGEKVALVGQNLHLARDSRNATRARSSPCGCWRTGVGTPVRFLRPRAGCAASAAPSTPSWRARAQLRVAASCFSRVRWTREPRFCPGR